MSPDFQLYYKEATVIETVKYWKKKKKTKTDTQFNETEYRIRNKPVLIWSVNLQPWSQT